MSCTVIIKDKNLKPENIKKDVVILKVKGPLEAGGGEPVLESKTVDSSTVSQNVVASQGYDGLSSVTVNAVTSSIDANIQAGNIKKDVTILGITGTYESTPVQPVLQDVSVAYTMNGTYTLNASSGYDGLGTVDISVNFDASANWIEEAKAGNIHDLSSYTLYEPSRDYQYYSMFNRSEIEQLPDMSNWTSISGSSTCQDMFLNASYGTPTTNIADLSSVTTLSGSSCVKGMFNGTKITELWLPNLYTIASGAGLENIIGRTETATLKTMKINAKVAQAYGMLAALTRSSLVSGVENIEMTGVGTQNMGFDYMSNLTAASVLSILTHTSSAVYRKTITFYTGGLTVQDDAQGSIQAAYDAATAAGWIINNLTIVAP